jgi:biopolymer transport protein ExbD
MSGAVETGGGKRKISIRIDMTPMVDVIILLLIFFFMTSQFREPKGVQITLPKEQKEQQQSQQRVAESTVVNIEVAADGTIWSNLGRVNGQLELALPDKVTGDRAWTQYFDDDDPGKLPGQTLQDLSRVLVERQVQIGAEVDALGIYKRLLVIIDVHPDASYGSFIKAFDAYQFAHDWGDVYKVSENEAKNPEGLSEDQKMGARLYLMNAKWQDKRDLNKAVYVGWLDKTKQIVDNPDFLKQEVASWFAAHPEATLTANPTLDQQVEKLKTDLLEQNRTPELDTHIKAFEEMMAKPEAERDTADFRLTVEKPRRIIAEVITKYPDIDTWYTRIGPDPADLVPPLPFSINLDPDTNPIGPAYFGGAIPAPVAPGTPAKPAAGGGR